MEDRTGTRMCQGCAEDAMDSGLFYTKNPTEYASPVHHHKKWPAWSDAPFERVGAKPIKKIRLPKGHPSGEEEIRALTEGQAASRKYWEDVAEEMSHPEAVVSIVNPLQRRKTIVSHAGVGRWLREARPAGYMARQHLPVRTPYSGGPTIPVYQWRGQPCAVAETSHRRYEIWCLDPSVPVHRRDKDALAEFVSLQRNPRRPPKRWWRSCVKKVGRTRVRDPKKVCGSEWYHKMAEAKKRKALARENRTLRPSFCRACGHGHTAHAGGGDQCKACPCPACSCRQCERRWRAKHPNKKNPLVLFNPGKNGKALTRGAQLIYNRLRELWAYKERHPSLKSRTPYRHVFRRRTHVQVWGLADGSVLLKSAVGKPLWRKD